MNNDSQLSRYPGVSFDNSFKPPVKSSGHAYPNSPAMFRVKRRPPGTIPVMPPSKTASVARRNARERNRVKQVNQGFSALKQHLPSGSKSKKMSKVETLRRAVDYIRNLQELLGYDCSSLSSDIDYVDSDIPSVQSDHSSDLCSDSMRASPPQRSLSEQSTVKYEAENMPPTCLDPYREEYILPSTVEQYSLPKPYPSYPDYVPGLHAPPTPPTSFSNEPCHSPNTSISIEHGTVLHVPRPYHRTCDEMEYDVPVLGPDDEDILDAILTWQQSQ